jgi:hypothetical protein
MTTSDLYGLTSYQQDTFGAPGAPISLLDLARRVRQVVDAALMEHSDLWGGSILDLCADNIPDVSLADLKAAIVVSGLEGCAHVNARLKFQIGKYR